MKKLLMMLCFCVAVGVSPSYADVTPPGEQHTEQGTPDANNGTGDKAGETVKEATPGETVTEAKTGGGCACNAQMNAPLAAGIWLFLLLGGMFLMWRRPAKQSSENK